MGTSTDVSQEVRGWFEALGLSPGHYRDADVKKRYRKLMKDCHPDRGGDPERAASITEAYERLETADKRDKALKRMENGTPLDESSESVFEPSMPTDSQNLDDVIIDEPTAGRPQQKPPQARPRPTNPAPPPPPTPPRWETTYFVRRRDPLAIGALIVAIFGAGCGWPFSLWMGYRSLRNIRESQGRLKGTGMAGLAMLISCGGIAILVFAMVSSLSNYSGSGTSFISSSRYESCKEMRVDYPKGVAKSRAAAQQYQQVSGSLPKTGRQGKQVYRLHKQLDKDRDGVACGRSG